MSNEKSMELSRILSVSMNTASTSMLFARESAASRLNASANIMTAVMATPDKGIPVNLLDKSKGIIIISGIKKNIYSVGADYGRGFMMSRLSSDAGWSAPAAIKTDNESFGFQNGGSGMDAIMLVMNDTGVEKMLSKAFALGSDTSVIAGPVGCDTSAVTDIQMYAEIVSYCRARGVLAGISLSGLTLHSDGDTNAELYGSQVTNRDILTGRKTRVSVAGTRLTAVMNRYSLRNK